MSNLYQYWEDGAKIYLRFIDQTWEIGIKWKDDICVLGKQWYVFAKESMLEIGDTLILFRNPSPDLYNVNVCIFEGNEENFDEGTGDF